MTASHSVRLSQESRTIMSGSSHRTLHRLAVCVLLASAGLLHGCGTGPRDDMSTSSIPDDYRTRHPITLAEVEHTIDIPVATGETRLTTGANDVVGGFVQDYRAKSKGSIQIQFPTGVPNSSAAAMQRKPLRALLHEQGVPSSQIVETSYAADPAYGPAPVRMSFIAITAMTDQCGQWPKDIADNTIDNKNWHNFGCASQNNLAAQIASPMDLVAPRAMTPIDAIRRTTVIGLYREGKSTASN